MQGLKVAAAPVRRPAEPARGEEAPRGVLGLALVITAITMVPYLCGYLLTPPHRVFLGALNNVGDLTQYLAAIRQGSEGAWRYTNQFSPERSSALVMYFPYVLAGKVSLGMSPAVLFQVLRLFSAVLCLLALARFCRLFIGRQALRLGWLFVLMAGGLYWLSLLLSPLGLHFVEPVQLTAPELSPLITLLISPHESLGLAAELAGFALYLKGMGAPEALWTTGRPAGPLRHTHLVRHFGGASLAFRVPALSYPFLLLTAGLTLFAATMVNAATAASTRPTSATRKRDCVLAACFSATCADW